jgi:hypothetical protein
LDISGPKIRAASSLSEKGFGRPAVAGAQKAKKKTAKYEFSFSRLFAAIPHLRTPPQWP